MGARRATRHDAALSGFPVVGIGASAGGLGAAGIFLDHTPADTGMAFVLVFHLDPRHKSEAAELLQGHTQMPTAQIAGRTRLEPNHVYVIPPNHGLSLVDGELRLTKLARADGRPTVIDRFFRSLAGQAGARAVGVVLSGTGTEGSQGLRAIKEAGGLTVVQDEADAEYAGMPHSAIATGLVDFVLPVAEIPAKLVEVRNFPIDFTLPDTERAAGAGDAEALQKIFVQLRTRVGHDFTHYKRATILRRIARRMQVHCLQDIGAYLDLLHQNPAETEALFRELLISVTNFFRDPAAMATLEHDALPRLCGRMVGQTVRVWVPGCATGEEAYSLAMLLAETCDGLATPPRLQLFASDVDERALATARRGVYPDAVAGDISDARLQRFFDRDGDGFVVKHFLREMILFTRHDLLQDPPFSRLDLISCRNVLIYLRTEIQSRVFALFHFALKPQGYLFLGNSESLGGSGPLFLELDRKGRLFQARRVPMADVQLPLLSNPLRGGVQRRQQDAPRKRFAEIARDELLTHYAPPCVIVGENYDVTYISGRVGKYLEPGVGAANYNVLDMAREELRLELRGALYKAFHGGEGVQRKPVRMHSDGAEEVVLLTVRPLADAEGHLLVAFEAAGTDPAAAEPPRPADHGGMVAQLEGELANTRESLQTTIEELETSNEELRASNEELQSVNEELQSTSEELETGKEELQSTNEELLAVNQELQARNDDLAHSNADLDNLIGSTEIATLFLDEGLRVRRYTPRITELFNLIASDVGRPFAHLTHTLETEDLLADAQRVMRDLVSIERELASQDGRYYQTRVRPYRAPDNKVAGVVLTFVDVTERHRREQETRVLNAQLQTRTTFVESIVATLREPMLVLDADLRVVSANRAFYDRFKVAPRPPERTPLYELDQRQWDIPELRELLEKMLPWRTTIEGFEVRHDFGDGERVMMLNARRLEQDEEREPLILLAVEDITQQTRREANLALLAQIGENLVQPGELGVTLVALGATIGAHFRVALCAFVEFDEAHRVVAAVHEWTRTDVPGWKDASRVQAFHAGLFRRACADDETWVVRDSATDARVDTERLAARSIAALVSVPLPCRDGRCFELLVGDSRPRDWRDDELGTLREIALYAGARVARARIEQALRDSEERFRALVITTSDVVYRMSADWSELFNLNGGRFLADTVEPLREWIAAYIPVADHGRLRAAIRLATRNRDVFELEHRVIRADGTLGWAISRAAPILDQRGEVAEWFGAASDITDRKRRERDVVRLASIVNSSDDAIFSKDPEGRIVTWNRGAERMFGYRADEAIGRNITELTIPADRLDEEANILKRLAAGQSIDHFETVRRRKGGATLDVAVTISPLRVAGEVVGGSNIARDISERKQAEAHRDLLIHELNHRVKNTLAMIQALAQQTFRGLAIEAQVTVFEDRLMALSAAHDVLSQENWTGAELARIVREVLAPWSAGAAGAIAVDGPDLRLRPAAALALAMALHELATNAAKYGALSTRRGKVAIDWSVPAAEPRVFRLQWRERGGPSVLAPPQRGFGTRLIEHGLAHDLGGTVQLVFDPGGVECLIEAPLDEICEQKGVP